MRLSSIGFLFAAFFLSAKASHAADSIAHGYVCTVTFFPPATPWVPNGGGKYGSIGIGVQGNPECNSGVETNVYVVSAGSTINATPAIPKLSERQTMDMMHLLQNATFSNKRVNLIYDAPTRVIRWSNFFFR